MGEQNVQDFAGLFLAGKTAADISMSSKLQNFGLDILGVDEAFNRYGKDYGLDQQQFGEIYASKIMPEWERYNTGKFIQHETNILNLPNMHTVMGITPTALGRPYMIDNDKNDMYRTYGGVQEQINTPETIAMGKGVYYIDGDKKEFSIHPGSDGDKIDLKTQMELDAADKMLVARTDPENPNSVVWTAVSKEAAVSHEAVYNTFGQNFSMLKDYRALRGIKQTITDIPGALGHLGESVAKMGDAVGRLATGTGAPNSMEGDANHPTANFFRRWENFSARIRGGAVEDSAEDINTFQIANSLGQILEMMAVAYGTAGLGLLGEGAAAGTAAAVEGGSLSAGRLAMQAAMKSPRYASKIGAGAGIFEASTKAAGAWAEVARENGVNETDMAWLFPLIMAKTAVIEYLGPNKLINYWTKSGTKAFKTGMKAQLDAAKLEAGVAITAELNKQSLYRTILNGTNEFVEGLSKYRVGNALVAGGEEMLEEGADNPTTNAIQAFYDMAAPWIYKTKGMNTKDLANGNGLFGNNFSDMFDGTGKNMALGFIGGAFGGMMRKGVANHNKGFNDLAESYAQNGTRATKLALDAIEQLDQDGDFSYGPPHLTAPQLSDNGTPTPLVAGDDKSKSWNAYNKQRAIDSVMMMDKIYREQGGKAVFEMAQRADSVANQVIGDVRKGAGVMMNKVRGNGGLIHDQLYTNLRAAIIKNQIETLQEDPSKAAEVEDLQNQLSIVQEQAAKIWDGNRSLRFNEIYNDHKASATSQAFAMAFPSDTEPNIPSPYDYYRGLVEKYNDQINGNEEKGIKPISEINKAIQEKFDADQNIVHGMVDQLSGMGMTFTPEIGKMMGSIREMFGQHGISKSHADKLLQNLEGIKKTSDSRPDAEVQEFKDLNRSIKAELPINAERSPDLLAVPQSPFDIVLDFDEKSRKYSYTNSIEGRIAEVEKGLDAGEQYSTITMENFKDLQSQLNRLAGIISGNDVWDNYSPEEKVFHDTKFTLSKDQAKQAIEKLIVQADRVAEIVNRINVQNLGYKTAQQKFNYDKVQILSKVLGSALKHAKEDKLFTALETVIAKIPSFEDHVKTPATLNAIEKEIYTVITDFKKKDSLLKNKDVLPLIIEEFNCGKQVFNQNIRDYTGKDISTIFDFNRFMRNVNTDYNLAENFNIKNSNKAELQLIVFNMLNFIYKFKGVDVSTKLLEQFGKVEDADLGKTDKGGNFTSIEQDFMINEMFSHLQNPSNDLWMKFGELTSTTANEVGNIFLNNIKESGVIKNMMAFRGVAGAGKTTLVKTLARMMFSGTDKKPTILIIAPSTSLQDTYQKLLSESSNKVDFIEPKALAGWNLKGYDLIVYDEISTIERKDIPALAEKLNTLESNVPVIGLGDDMQILPRDEKGRVSNEIVLFGAVPRSMMLTWRFRTGYESIWKIANAALNAVTVGQKSMKVSWPNTVYNAAQDRGVQYFASNDELVQSWRNKLKTDPNTILIVKDANTALKIKTKYADLTDTELKNIIPTEINEQQNSVGGSEYDSVFVYNELDYSDGNFTRFILTAVTRPQKFLAITAPGKSVIGEDLDLSLNSKVADLKENYNLFLDRQKTLSGVKAAATTTTNASTDSQDTVLARLKTESNNIELQDKHYFHKPTKLFFQRVSNFIGGRKNFKPADAARGTQIHLILEGVINGESDAKIKADHATKYPKDTGNTANQASIITDIDGAIAVIREVHRVSQKYGKVIAEAKVISELIAARADAKASGVGGAMDILAVDSKGWITIIDLKTRGTKSRMSDADYAEKRLVPLNKYKELLEANKYKVHQQAIVMEIKVDLSEDRYTVNKMYEAAEIKMNLNAPKVTRDPKSSDDEEFNTFFTETTETETSPLQLNPATKAVYEHDEKDKIAIDNAIANVMLSTPATANGEYSGAVPSSMMASGRGEGAGATTNEELVELLGRQKTAKAKFVKDNPSIPLRMTYYGDITDPSCPLWSTPKTIEDQIKQSSVYGTALEDINGKKTVPAVVFSLDMANEQVQEFFEINKVLFKNQDLGQIEANGANIVSTMWLPEKNDQGKRKLINESLNAVYKYAKSMVGKKAYAVVSDEYPVNPTLLRTGWENGVQRKMPLQQLIQEASSRGINASDPYMIREEGAERGIPAGESKVNFYIDLTFPGDTDSVRVKLEPNKITEDYYDSLKPSVEQWKASGDRIKSMNPEEMKEEGKKMYRNNLFWQILAQNQSKLIAAGIPHLSKRPIANGAIKLQLPEKSKLSYYEMLSEVYEAIKSKGLVEELTMWSQLNFDAKYNTDQRYVNKKYKLHSSAIGTMTALAGGLYQPRLFFRADYLGGEQQVEDTTTKAPAKKRNVRNDIPFMRKGLGEPAVFTTEASQRELLERTLSPEFLQGKLDFKPNLNINGKTAYGALYYGRILIESIEGKVHAFVARHERMHAIINHFLDDESKARLLDAAKKHFNVTSDIHAEEELAIWAGKRYHGIVGKANYLIDTFLSWVNGALERFGIHMFELNAAMAKAEKGYWYDKPIVNHVGVERLMPKEAEGEINPVEAVELEEQEDGMQLGENDLENHIQATWLDLASKFGHIDYRDAIFKMVIRQIKNYTTSNLDYNSENLSIIDAINTVRNEWKESLLDSEREQLDAINKKIEDSRGSWHRLSKEERDAKVSELLGTDGIFETLVRKQYPTYRLNEATMSPVTYGGEITESTGYDSDQKSIAYLQATEAVNPDFSMSQKLVDFLTTIPEGDMLDKRNTLHVSKENNFLNVQRAKNLLNIIASTFQYIPTKWGYSFNGEERMIAYISQRLADSPANSGERNTLQSLLHVLGGPDNILSIANPNFGSIRSRVASNNLTIWDYSRNLDLIIKQRPGLEDVFRKKSVEATLLLNSFFSFYENMTFKNNAIVKVKDGNYAYQHRDADSANDIAKNMKNQIMSALFTPNGDIYQVTSTARKRFSAEDYNVVFKKDGISLQGRKVINVDAVGKSFKLSFTSANSVQLQMDVARITDVLILKTLNPKTISSFLQTKEGQDELATALGTLLYSANHAMAKQDIEENKSIKKSNKKKIEEYREEGEMIEKLRADYVETGITYKSFRSLPISERTKYAGSGIREKWSIVQVFNTSDGYILEGGNASTDKITDGVLETKVLQETKVAKGLKATYNDNATSIAIHKTGKVSELNKQTSKLIDTILDANPNIIFKITDDPSNIEILKFLKGKGAKVEVYTTNEHPFMVNDKRYERIEMAYGYAKGKTGFDARIDFIHRNIKKLEEEKEKHTTIAEVFPDIMQNLARQNDINMEALTSINSELGIMDLQEQVETDSREKEAEAILHPGHFYNQIKRLADRQAVMLDKNSYKFSYNAKNKRVYAMGQSSLFDRTFGGKEKAISDKLGNAVMAELKQVDIQLLNSAILNIDELLAVTNPVSEYGQYMYLKNKKDGLLRLIESQNLNQGNLIYNGMIKSEVTENIDAIKYDKKGIDVNRGTINNYAQAMFDAAFNEMSKYGNKSTLIMTLAARGDSKKMLTSKVQFSKRDAAGTLYPIDWFAKENYEASEDAWDVAIEHAKNEFELTRKLNAESRQRLAKAFNDDRFNKTTKPEDIFDIFQEGVEKWRADGQDIFKSLSASGLYINIDYMPIDYGNNEAFPAQYHTTPTQKQFIPGNAAFGDMAIGRGNWIMYGRLRQSKQPGYAKQISSKIAQYAKSSYRYSLAESELFLGKDRITQKAWLDKKFEEDYSRLATVLIDNNYTTIKKTRPAGFGNNFRKDGKAIPYYKSYIMAYHLVNSSFNQILDGHPFNYTSVVSALKKATVAIGDAKMANADDPSGLRHKQNFVVLHDLKKERLGKMFEVTEGMIFTSPIAQERAYYGFGGEGGMVTRGAAIKWLGNQINKQTFLANQTKCAGFPMSAEYLEASPMLMDMFMNSMSKQLRDHFEMLYTAEKESGNVNAFDDSISQLNEYIDDNDLHDHYIGYYQYASTAKATTRDILDYDDFKTYGGYEPDFYAKQTIETKNLGVIMNAATGSNRLDTKPFTQLENTLGIEIGNTDLFRAMAKLDSDITDNYMEHVTAKIEKEGFKEYARRIGKLAAANMSDGYFAALVNNENISIDHTNLEIKLMTYFANQLNKNAIKPTMSGMSLTQMPLDFFTNYIFRGISMGYADLERFAKRLGVSTEQAISESVVTDYKPFDKVDGKMQIGSCAMPFMYADRFGLPTNLQPSEVTSVLTGENNLVDLRSLKIHEIASLIKSQLRADGIFDPKFYDNFIISKFLNREKAVVTYKANLAVKKKLAKEGEDISNIEIEDGVMNSTSEDMWENGDVLYTEQGIRNLAKQINLSAKEVFLSSKKHPALPYKYEPGVLVNADYTLTEEQINKMANEISIYIKNFEEARTVFINKDPSNPSSAGFYMIDQFFYKSSNTVLIPGLKNAIDGGDNDYDQMKAYMYGFAKNGRRAIKDKMGALNKKMDKMKTLFMNPANASLVMAPTNTSKYNAIIDRVGVPNDQFNDLATNIQNWEYASAGATGIGIAANGMVNISTTVEAYINSKDSGVGINSVMTNPAVPNNRSTLRAVDVVQMHVDNIKLMQVGLLGINRENQNALNAYQFADVTGENWEHIYQILNRPEVKNLFRQVEFKKGGVTNFESLLDNIGLVKRNAKSRAKEFFRVEKEDREMTKEEIDAKYSFLSNQADIINLELQDQNRAPSQSETALIDSFGRFSEMTELYAASQENGIYDELENLIYAGETLNRYGTAYKLRNGIPTDAYDRYNLKFQLEQMFDGKLDDVLVAYHNLNYLNESHKSEQWESAYSWMWAFDNIPSDERRTKVIAYETKLRTFMDARGVMFNLPDLMSRIEAMQYLIEQEEATFINGSKVMKDLQQNIMDIQKITHMTRDQFYAFRAGLKKAQYALYYSEMASEQPERLNFLDIFKEYMTQVEKLNWKEEEFDMKYKVNQDKFIIYFPKMVAWLQQNTNKEIVDPKLLTNNFIQNISVVPFEGNYYLSYDKSDEAESDAIKSMVDSFNEMEDYTAQAFDHTNIPFGPALQNLFAMYTHLYYGEAYKKGHLLQVINDEVHEPFQNWMKGLPARINNKESSFILEGRNVTSAEIFGDSLAIQIILKDDINSPFIYGFNKDHKKSTADRSPRYTKKWNKVNEYVTIPLAVYHQAWYPDVPGAVYTPQKLKFLSYNPFSFAESIDDLVTEDRVLNRISESEYKKLIQYEEATINQKGHVKGSTIYIRGIEATVMDVDGRNVTVERKLIDKETWYKAPKSTKASNTSYPVLDLIDKLRNEGYEVTDEDIQDLNEAHGIVEIEELESAFKERKNNC